MVLFFTRILMKNKEIFGVRGIGSQMSIAGPYEPKQGYGNWFWRMTPCLIELMLNCAGFKIKERYLFNFRAVFVCEVTEIKFIPESGEWITPKDEKYIKFRR